MQADEIRFLFAYDRWATRQVLGELLERWEAEWAAVDAWLPTLTDDFAAYVHEGVPVWQRLVHVVNHGPQHRAEAAALLTGEGRSPGELDLINYADERADGGNQPIDERLAGSGHSRTGEGEDHRW